MEASLGGELWTILRDKGTKNSVYFYSIKVFNALILYKGNLL